MIKWRLSCLRFIDSWPSWAVRGEVSGLGSLVLQLLVMVLVYKPGELHCLHFTWLVWSPAGDVITHKLTRSTVWCQSSMLLSGHKTFLCVHAGLTSTWGQIILLPGHICPISGVWVWEEKSVLLLLQNQPETIPICPLQKHRKMQNWCQCHQNSGIKKNSGKEWEIPLFSEAHTSRARPSRLARGRGVDAAVLQHWLTRCPCISHPSPLLLVDKSRVLSALSNTAMQWQPGDLKTLLSPEETLRSAGNHTHTDPLSGRR